MEKPINENSIYIFHSKNGHQKCIDLKKIVSIDYTTDKKLIVRLVNKLSDFEIPDTSQESYEDLLLIWSHWCE
ncbi:hypothetical protein [Actinobacillus pleuropneumoniae]|uniref:hypothetical protein n=1 Tax=Actinobacillus pleuropneumoniae TaxID=715 RepID=UPI003F7C7ECF